MLALPASAIVAKVDVLPTTAIPALIESPLNPPIITHTAATPMATPHGSPNENTISDKNNKLSISMTRKVLKPLDADKAVRNCFAFMEIFIKTNSFMAEIFILLYYYKTLGLCLWVCSE